MAIAVVEVTRVLRQQEHASHARSSDGPARFRHTGRLDPAWRFSCRARQCAGRSSPSPSSLAKQARRAIAWQQQKLLPGTRTRLADVNPKRSVVPKHAPHIAKHLDQLRHVLVRRFLGADFQRLVRMAGRKIRSLAEIRRRRNTRLDRASRQAWRATGGSRLGECGRSCWRPRQVAPQVEVLPVPDAGAELPPLVRLSVAAVGTAAGRDELHHLPQAPGLVVAVVPVAAGDSGPGRRCSRAAGERRR